MAIDAQDIETLKAYFVTRDRCDTTVDEIEKKLSNDNVKLALIEQELKTINWVSKTTLGSVIAGIVAIVLAKIF